MLQGRRIVIFHMLLSGLQLQVEPVFRIKETWSLLVLLLGPLNGSLKDLCVIRKGPQQSGAAEGSRVITGDMALSIFGHRPTKKRILEGEETSQQRTLGN